MSIQFKTLKVFIQEMAQTTGVSQDFVESVIALFREKNISLESDAAPYLPVISQTFACHAETEKTCARIQADIDRLCGALNELRSICFRPVRQNHLPAGRPAPAPQERESQGPSVLLLRPGLLLN